MLSMDEFSLIDTYFKSIVLEREDVIFGIGDDAACLHVPEGMELLISTDTLVDGVHFLNQWDAYDIACRAVNVNLSDMAAMAATPCWISLALTLPHADQPWLQRFSQGLVDSLKPYQIALIGGDTTRGPLSITITIHGLAPKGRAIRRSGALVNDKIVLSGNLGGAALAVDLLKQVIDEKERDSLMKKLLHPIPRLDLLSFLCEYATSAIDVSDGLSADLNHILTQSKVGACLFLESIPIHPLVVNYEKKNAIDFALSGGDDYEICFTVNPKDEVKLFKALEKAKIDCNVIGVIEAEPGLRGKRKTGEIIPLQCKGYQHFT